MRFVLMPPGATRPSLVVDTVAEVDANALAHLRDDLYGLGCSHGILFDAVCCVILRDSFVSMDAASIVEDGRVPTREVLRGGASDDVASLDARVELWLQTLSVDWDHALPIEPSVAALFIQDIVPAASGSLVRAMQSAA